MPQRTADRRRIEPTPMIAPVIVCVVLTGHAEVRRGEERDRAGGLRGEAADGLQLGDLRAHRVDDAPAARERAERDRGVRGEHDPDRNRQMTVVELQVAAGDQRAGDDAHRLLRVVAAVPEAVGRGRQQLQPPEPLIDAARRRALEDPEDGHHQERSRGSCR